MKIILSCASLAGALALSLTAQETKPAPKYVGADQCKTCHNAKSQGSMHAKWSETKHAKALEALASEKAKAYSKDPQKDEACLACHTTGGLPNVQCEACHGPAEKHVKARKADEAFDDQEIVRKPDAKTCAKCHNDKSPTFQPFCFKERFEKIQHLDPRKKHEPVTCDCEKCRK